jgi:phosphoribosylglycinamide formyltransferase-1
LKKIAILLSGRGSNFISIYNSIKKDYINAEISIVISNKKDAPGLNFAKNEGLNTHFADFKNFNSREEYDHSLIKIINDYGADLVCLAGYMRIVTKDFVEAFKDRLINIHPSLLPSFPGLDAQKQAIEYGVKYSGCTVHFVDEKVDHGAIILQSVVKVDDNDTEETLSAKILKEEHKIYPKAVKLFIENKLKIKGRKVFIKD